MDKDMERSGFMGIAKYSEDNRLMGESRLRQRDLRLAAAHFAKKQAAAAATDAPAGNCTENTKKQGGIA